MRFFWAFAVFLFVVNWARAEANIPGNARVANEAPGYCFWCCLETMARHQHVRELYDLKNARKTDPALLIGGEVIPANAGSYPSVVDKLAQLRFTRYRIQPDGDYSTRLLDEATRAGKACLVHIEMDDGAGVHAVLIIEFGSEVVKYWDPNHAEREYLWDTRANFDRARLGLALVLD
jgi:hypothetical protein